MKFENPAPLDREAAEHLLAHGSEDEIQEALVATCLGHLARIHRKLDLPNVLARLEELREDPRTAGYADNALDDIEMYIGKKRRD